jgi:hypothetical protein
MIELVYILRTIVEAIACGGKSGEALHQDSDKKCAKSAVSIKFDDLKRLVYDELWGKSGIAIYTTAWEMERELERLRDFGVIKYEDSEVKIENPSDFLEKTKPFMLIAKSMIGDNDYLKHVINDIEEAARNAAKDIKERNAAKNTKESGLVPQPV